MDEARILALLRRLNVWWDDKDVPASLKKSDYHRRDFYVAKRQLSKDRRILTIRGPRQVGKTTLSGQLIDDLLENGVPPEHVLYLTADNSQVLSNPDHIIRDTIETYEQYVLRRALTDVSSTVYVFIDEVQKIDDWASVLKYYIDTYTEIRFVVTGSVSSLIKQDANETLVGRRNDQVILPMKFVDHVRYFELFDKDEITKRSNHLRDALKRAVRSDSHSEFAAELAGFYGEHEDKKPQLTAKKDRYLLNGGYPGVLDDENLADVYAKLDQDIRSTVTGDLTNVFNVEKSEKVLQVLSMIVDSTCGKLNVQKIADSAGINRDTVERYLDYLEEFFLINRCPKYTSSEYRSGGRPKVYVQDVGLYNTLAGTLTEETLRDANRMGPVFETVICDHARRLQFALSNAQNADIAYWDQTGEVDFVLSGSEYFLPIEVKNGDPSNANLRGISKCVERTDAPFGLVVNNADVFEQDGDLLHVPAWIFLFMC